MATALLGLGSAVYGAPSWYADYEIDADNFFREPSFEQFSFDEMSSGYTWRGRGWHPAVPSVRFVNFATRFEPDGAMGWAAAWEPNVEAEIGSTISRQTFTPSGRFDDVLAAYVLNEPEKTERVHLALFNGRTRGMHYSLAFDQLDLGMGANTVTNIGVFPDSVTGFGQTHEGVLKMLLIDADGEPLVDRFYDYDFSFMPPGVPLPANFDWRAMPDGSGYQVVFGNTLTRFDLNGDVIWSKWAYLISDYTYFAPDGSTVFLSHFPGDLMDSPVAETVTLVHRVDAAGDLTWSIRIDDFRPVEGRRAVLSHGSVLLLGYPDREDGTFSPPYWDACKVVRLDAATGAVLGQARLSVEDGMVAFPGVAGWTGQDAVVSFESERVVSTDPMPSYQQSAHLVKVDAAFQEVEARNLALSGTFNHGALPHLNLYYDPDGSQFFYAGFLQRRAGEIDRTLAVLMDEELNSEAECDPFVPGEIVLASGDWVAPVSGPWVMEDVTVAVSEADTEFFAANDFEIEAFPIVTTDPCDAAPPVVTYATWAQAIFGPDDAGDPELSGPAVDLTGDGVTNLEAYIFGLNPKVNNDPRAGVVVAQEDEYLTLSFRRRANTAGYEVMVEGAYQLGDWTAPVVMENGPVDGQGMVTTTARLGEPLSSAPGGFLRVMIRGN